MRLLLDTHALLWGLLDDPRLSHPARDALSDPDTKIVVSAVSIFEITLKHRLGKLSEAASFVARIEQTLATLDWISLAIGMDHAALAGTLDLPHKDPFDRLLIAQARIEGIALVSNEALFDGFGIKRLW